MEKVKTGIVVSSLLLGLSTVNATEDLGEIQIYSSTIDDKFEAKKGEASSVTTISGEKVDEAHATNIHEVLRSIPGLTSEVSTGDSLKIHIRGVENQMYMGENRELQWLSTVYRYLKEQEVSISILTISKVSR